MFTPAVNNASSIIIHTAKSVYKGIIYYPMKESFKGYLLADNKLVVETKEYYKEPKVCIQNLINAETELRFYAKIIMN